ncbi:MAG: autotransporter outer membrane beta-barrel domain-containing protein [Bacteroidales bacterium]|nr:autotransporter outer membrane beta-barrel domain-containing protein [Bacteroidales bacterium]
MKKILVIVSLFALNWQASAQSLERRNELKICLAHLLAGSLKVGYERLLNDFSSVGASGFYSFSNLNHHRSSSRGLEGQLLGFYRLYFGQQPISGFFLEGNLGLNWIRHYTWSAGVSRRSYDAAFGVGIALGWKWYIPRTGIVLDVFAGGGRLFGSDHQNAFPRAGISIGRRF